MGWNFRKGEGIGVFLSYLKVEIKSVRKEKPVHYF